MFVEAVFRKRIVVRWLAGCYAGEYLCVATTGQVVES